MKKFKIECSYELTTDLREFARLLNVPTKISVSNPDWTSEAPSDVAPTMERDLSEDEILERCAKSYKPIFANYFTQLALNNLDTPVSDTNEYDKIVATVVQDCNTSIKVVTDET